MTDLAAIIWGIFAVIGIGCTISAVSSVLVLYFVGRCERFHWETPQAEPPTWRVEKTTTKTYARPDFSVQSDDEGPMPLSRINWPNNGRRF